MARQTGKRKSRSSSSKKKSSSKSGMTKTEMESIQPGRKVDEQ